MALGTFIGAVAMGKVTFNTPIPVYASQYLNRDGGRFMTLDTGTGTYKLTTADSSQIDAWVECSVSESLGSNPSVVAYILSNATSGVTVLPGTKDIYNGEVMFALPVKSGSTIAATYLDQLVDIVTAGSTTTLKQYADIDATTDKLIKIVGMDITNNVAYVRPVQKSA